MTALLTPEQIDDVRVRHVVDAGFSPIRESKKNLAQSWRVLFEDRRALLRDREAITERLESIINERLAPYSDKQYGKGELRALVTAIRGEK